MKLPPKEKFYEALSAIGDDRVTMLENRALVQSSDGSKTYTVEWDGDVYASDDNATYWGQYPGYPILSVLLLQGRLTLDREHSKLLRGVDWHALNQAHKRDYAKAVAQVLGELTCSGVDVEPLRRAVENLQKDFEQLQLTVKRGRRSRT